MVHLSDTLGLTDLRRETLRLPNHGELVHALQRQIRRAGFEPCRGRRKEKLFAHSGPLTPLANLVMAWNTAKTGGRNRSLAERDRSPHS